MTAIDYRKFPALAKLVPVDTDRDDIKAIKRSARIDYFKTERLSRELKINQKLKLIEMMKKDFHTIGVANSYICDKEDEINQMKAEIKLYNELIQKEEESV